MEPSSNDALPEATDELLDKYRLKFSVMTNFIAGGPLVTAQGRDRTGSKYYILNDADVLTLTSMVNLLLKRVETDKVDLAANDFEVKQLTERNQVLQQKAMSSEGKLGKLMNRVNDLQAEVDAFQRWKLEHTEKLKVMGAEVPDVKEIKQLQEENRRLRDELAKEKADHLLDEQESLMDIQNQRKTISVLKLENQALTAHLTTATETNEAQEESFTRQLDHLSLFVRVLTGVYPEVDIFYVRNLIQQLLVANEDSE